MRWTARRRSAGAGPLGLWLVVTYPTPEGAPQASDFQVKVDGQAQFVHDSAIAAFCTFSFRGKVRVSVTHQKAFARVDIRPKSRNVSFTVEDGTIHFDLERPCQLSIELDGDIERPLFLFANPPEKKTPKPDHERMHYFGPGKVYDVGEIILTSGEMLYIAGGAVVRGRVRAENARNVRVAGYGVLDGTHRDTKTQMLKFSRCTGVEVSGIVILGSYGWTVVPIRSDNVKIDNVKIVGWRDNDDGVDIVGCHNLTVPFVPANEGRLYGQGPPAYFEGGERPTRRPEGRARNSCCGKAEWGNAMRSASSSRPSPFATSFKDCDIIHVERGGTFTIHHGTGPS